MNNTLKSITIVSLMILFGCGEEKTKLHVYTWSDYFSPELIECFENENDCHVVIDTFDSNEQMYAKLKAGCTGFDILTPTSYQISQLIQEGLIQKLNNNLITNVVLNFNHDLDNQVLDNKFTWSVPYACTYTGLMFSKEKVENPDSWNCIGNDKFKGKISLLDDIRETIGIGLMYRGYSLNSTNETEIMEAAKQIVEWKKNVRKFDSESYKLEVADGSSWIGHGYSSDAAQVIISDERTDIGFVLPKEGFTIAWDEFVISSSAKNVELAHRFIDFFYENNNALSNTIYICSLTANRYACENLPENYKKVLIPDNIEKGQLLKSIENLDAFNYYNKAWDLIKATK